MENDTKAATDDQNDEFKCQLCKKSDAINATLDLAAPLDTTETTTEEVRQAFPTVQVLQLAAADAVQPGHCRCNGDYEGLLAGDVPRHSCAVRCRCNSSWNQEYHFAMVFFNTMEETRRKEERERRRRDAPDLL